MTMKHNSFLMQDLSKKSEALTNTLIPRNPIAPRNKKKYPTHSEFGFSMKDQHVKKRYDELLNSKMTATGMGGQSPNIEGSIMSKRMRNDARKSMNSVNGTVTIPNSTMQDMNKRSHIPFHQKRAKEQLLCTGARKQPSTGRWTTFKTTYCKYGTHATTELWNQSK